MTHDIYITQKPTASQLNLEHGTKNGKSNKEKLKTKDKKAQKNWCTGKSPWSQF